MPTFFAEHGEIQALFIDVLSADLDDSFHFTPLDQIVHAIERFQESGFAAARGTYHRRYLFFGDGHIDIFQRLKIPVKKIHFPDLDGDMVAEYKFVDRFHIVCFPSFPL